MDAQGRPSLSELKVGIFVLITCIILGVAIFTIGTQVGLFEDVFYAKTYLNTVSGLKPGDLVLLAGVEVGNVVQVQVTSPGQLPPTQTNRMLLEEIERINREMELLQQRVPQTEAELRAARERHEQAVAQYGTTSRQAGFAQREVNSLEELLDNQTDQLADLQGDIQRAKNSIQNIEVVMQIRSEHKDWIREDSRISLGSIGLLGDKYIDISLGRSDEPPAVDEETFDTWLGDETRTVVVITGTSQPGFQELITGADDVLANLETLSDRLAGIMIRLSEGEGSVGRFLTDTSFYNNLNNAVSQANTTATEATQLVRELRSGDGTIAQLVQEREVYDRINVATERFENLLSNIDQGSGTLGRFVKDPSLYEKSDRIVSDIQSITGRIQAGEGTLGRLSVDDKVYEDLRQSLDQLSAFIEDVEQGKGTLGRLAKDEELYRNINEASSEIVKLLYDFRQNPRKFLTIKLELF